MDASEATKRYLKHLYAVYLGVRACTEISQELTTPEYLPSVTLEEARRTLRAIDLAAKEVGIDVDALWAEVAPTGAVTAEALKSQGADHLGRCRQMGGLFRVDVSNLQLTLRALGSKRSVIEKDF